MITLKVEKRNPEVKAKKLRRDGFVCGVLYGKEMKESTPIQLMEPEALRFIKANKEGTQVMLDLDGKQVDALVKNIDYDPMKKQIMALDFQALVAGETVATSVQVILENEDAAQGIVEQTLNEVHYKADPANIPCKRSGHSGRQDRTHHHAGGYADLPHCRVCQQWRG